ncbi:23S rRNA (pseudouridine1915-N3)-methyltransferase [Leucobacter luti]|uniref:23S rRNA (pseudouridine(1915)-N(3))-methyltransferase RlmH n=1 Tax=Leucobacter luti TaxID=340320 RepID=UPI0010E4CA9B|nr:23S rRNA (pseudouridine(1915)-N(3))-methyltransferase RlmH [Leucobacter luti]MCW2289130.1 23S rRNA (pseudouridine1915-N3)-methyltransferase [Leucobacter luti]TCK35473.1 23S rRNA (pseudouridine1915-N3)-methyltransferase [Leucobacter luti]
MSIKILAVGKKHESWVADGIARYEQRLRKPYELSWQLVPHSSREGDAARSEESDRIIAKLDRNAFVVVLDERGRNVDSPALAKRLQTALEASRPIVVVIGGAYGVTEVLRQRADFVWSLSALVFPHQLVRLILAEQLYRAQEISAGRGYHHV